MSMDFNINVNEAAKEFSPGFRLVAPGWHREPIITATMQDTSKKDGKMVVIDFGNGLKRFINVFNPSDKAQAIGRAELAKIFQCVGIEGDISLKDVPKLFGRYIDIEVIIDEKGFKKLDGSYAPANKIINYRPASQESPKSSSGSTGDDVPW